jgi:immunity protein 53 of polymorphic toxin system
VTTLEELQHWYRSQCDGDWEHGDGIKIESLDNPGWRVRISLRDTNLKSKPFRGISRLEPENDWIRCWVQDGYFEGAGDAHKLEEILQTFLTWSKSQ